jgi:adenylate cyclase
LRRTSEYADMNITGVLGVAFLMLRYFVQQKNKFQEQSETLLLNILPKEISEILKNETRSIADHFAEASILFADCVRFTPLSASMDPADLVAMLDEVFLCFDRLVEKHGVEKIKTIGDCYMVGSGVPRPRADHATALARLSLDMRAAVEQQTFRGQRLAFRIGMNSGPVIAGVIGRKRFIYDLWGDAVNTASRMKLMGRPG